MACEIVGLKGKRNGGTIDFEGETRILPLTAMERLGIDTGNGRIREECRDMVRRYLGEKGFNGSKAYHLAGLNDTGVSFDVIADIIEMDVLH